MDGCSTHWMQCAGAPAAIAASRTTVAAADEHCWAPGWNAKMIGLRVFSAIRLLKMAVEVGFVTGVMPQTTPTGSAISTMPEISSSLITPTVLRYCREWVICSETKMFLTALSSNTPRPVSATAAWANSPCCARAATAAFFTMKSICSWVKSAYAASAAVAFATSGSMTIAVSERPVSVGVGVVVRAPLPLVWGAAATSRAAPVSVTPA